MENNVGNDGAKALAKALENNQSIVTLDIYENCDIEIRDEIAKYCKRNAEKLYVTI